MWYTIVQWGADPAPSRGPFQSIAEADMAVERFCKKWGSEAGTYLAVGCVRLLGPFQTRETARDADIGDNVPIVKVYD